MSKIFFTIIIIFSIFWTLNAQATSRVIFPDSRSLQPIPTEVKPNISGNINYSEIQNNIDQTYNESAVQNKSQNKNFEKINNVNETKKEFNPSVLYWFLIFLFLFSFLIILIKKLRGIKNE